MIIGIFQEAPVTTMISDSNFLGTNSVGLWMGTMKGGWKNMIVEEKKKKKASIGFLALWVLFVCLPISLWLSSSSGLKCYSWYLFLLLSLGKIALRLAVVSFLLSISLLWGLLMMYYYRKNLQFLILILWIRDVSQENAVWIQTLHCMCLLQPVMSFVFFSLCLVLLFYS